MRPAAARWWELLSLFVLAFCWFFYFRSFVRFIPRAIFFAGAVALAILSLVLFSQYHFSTIRLFPPR